MPQIEADAREGGDRPDKKWVKKAAPIPHSPSLPLDILKAEQRGNLWSLGQ